MDINDDNFRPLDDDNGPSEVKPIVIMIPVSSIYNWFKQRFGTKPKTTNVNDEDKC